MESLKGPSNRILEIDLNTQKWSVYNVSEEENKMFLGGKGLGLKLLFDRMKPGIDPLSEENIFTVIPGPLLGTGAICSGRFAAVSKSPLTGIMASSSCGGPFGMSLKTAGWEGIILKGKMSVPSTIHITKDSVIFKKAGELWGMDTVSVQDKLISDKKRDGALVIGPAGENLVRYANIVSGHRFLGRAGLGAVLGSKNIKAIVATGQDYRLLPVDKEGFTKVKKRASKYIKSSEILADGMKKYGTAMNAKWANEGNLMPMRNFKDGQDPRAMDISGQTMAEKHNTKPHTCKPCSIICGHKGTFEDKKLSVPEFETVGLLGSNIGVFDSVKIANWNQTCTEMGIDTISTGGTIAWAMEATEKGLFESDLKFGHPDNIEQTLRDIGYAKGIGVELGQGSKRLSEKYGGTDFAIHVKGMEMSAYDPRGAIGQGLSYAVANRGACHLSAYPIALECIFGLLDPQSTKGKAEFTYFLENLYACVNSMHTCLFTAFGYVFEPPLTKHTPDPLLGFLMQNTPKMAIELTDFSVNTQLWSTITGIEISNKEFLQAGERIHVLERYMNTREGISRKDDTLPERILNQPRESDPNPQPIPLDKMLNKYYKLRGFTKDGIPTKNLMKKLGLHV